MGCFRGKKSANNFAKKGARSAHNKANQPDMFFGRYRSLQTRRLFVALDKNNVNSKSKCATL